MIVLEFRVLGTVEVRAGGRTLPARRPQQHAVLAALLIDAGRLVPVDTLIDRVWGSGAPEQARRSLQIHLTRIRKQLAAPDGRGAVLSRYPGGYRLDVEADQVDLHRSRRLVERAREADRPAGQRLEFLRQALELWRGEALGGIPGRWAAGVREAWRQWHLDVVVVWARAELRRGDPGVTVAPLRELAEQHPLVEPLTAALMLALVGTGRTAAALERYDHARHLLADELGIDPGPELRAAYQEILHHGMAAAGSRQWGAGSRERPLNPTSSWFG